MAQTINSEMKGFSVSKTIRFLKLRWVSLGLSALIIAAGVFQYFNQGGFELGIDFEGGARVEASIADDNASVTTVREIFTTEGLESEVVTIGSGEDLNYLVTIAGAEGGTVEDMDRIQNILTSHYGEETVEILGSELIGPKIGEGFASRSVQLILIVSVLILLYTALRFDFYYGAGAIAALFHDILIMLAFTIFLKIRLDITIVAALLTILGYSINDSIVVFDRVRENHKINPEEDYEYVMDKSITQSLSRTIVTSLTTLFVAVAIFIWGGRVLKDFGLELIIGIVSGTYSSIFIASPVTFLLKYAFDKKTHILARDGSTEGKKKKGKK